MPKFFQIINIITIFVLNYSFAFTADRDSNTEINTIKKGKEFLLIDAEGSYYEGIIKKINGEKVSVKYYWQDGVRLKNPLEDSVESKDLTLLVGVSHKRIATNFKMPLIVTGEFANGVVRTGRNRYYYFNPNKFSNEVKTLQGIKREQEIYTKGVNGKYLGRVLNIFANGEIYYINRKVYPVKYEWTKIEKISLRKKPTLRPAQEEVQADESQTLVSLSELQSQNRNQ